MIRIPQHRPDGKLNDLKSFIRDLEGFQCKVDYWKVTIEACIGDGAVAFQELTSVPARLSRRGFESLCYCMNQIVDGTFEGVVDGSILMKLVAVDSTFWEITSSKEFENYMAEKYGEYVG